MTTTDTAAIRAHMEALEGFTPGPWKYRPHALDDWGDVRTVEGFRICQARDPSDLSDEYLAAHRKAGTDPSEHTARLIAAAPDMHRTIGDLLAVIETQREALASERSRLHRLLWEAAHLMSDRDDADGGERSADFEDWIKRAGDAIKGEHMR